jgi:hypothetical protein
MHDILNTSMEDISFLFTDYLSGTPQHDNDHIMGYEFFIAWCLHLNRMN